MNEDDDLFGSIRSVFTGERDREVSGGRARSWQRLVPIPAAVQAEGVPLTKMTGMMKIMTGFNPKLLTSDAELAELSGLLRDSGSTQSNQ